MLVWREVRGCGELIFRIEEVITVTETNTENEMSYRGGEARCWWGEK